MFIPGHGSEMSRLSDLPVRHSQERVLALVDRASAISLSLRNGDNPGEQLVADEAKSSLRRTISSLTRLFETLHERHSTGNGRMQRARLLQLDEAIGRRAVEIEAAARKVRSAGMESLGWESDADPRDVIREMDLTPLEIRGSIAAINNEIRFDATAARSVLNEDAVGTDERVTMYERLAEISNANTRAAFTGEDMLPERLELARQIETALMSLRTVFAYQQHQAGAGPDRAEALVASAQRRIDSAFRHVPGVERGLLPSQLLPSVDTHLTILNDRVRDISLLNDVTPAIERARSRSVAATMFLNYFEDGSPAHRAGGLQNSRFVQRFRSDDDAVMLPPELVTQMQAIPDGDIYPVGGATRDELWDPEWRDFSRMPLPDGSMPATVGAQVIRPDQSASHQGRAVAESTEQYRWIMSITNELVDRGAALPEAIAQAVSTMVPRIRAVIPLFSLVTITRNLLDGQSWRQTLGNFFDHAAVAIASSAVYGARNLINSDPLAGPLPGNVPVVHITEAGGRNWDMTRASEAMMSYALMEVARLFHAQYRGVGYTPGPDAHAVDNLGYAAAALTTVLLLQSVVQRTSDALGSAVPTGKPDDDDDDPEKNKEPPDIHPHDNDPVNGPAPDEHQDDDIADHGLGDGLDTEPLGDDVGPDDVPWVPRPPPGLAAAIPFLVYDLNGRLMNLGIDQIAPALIPELVNRWNNRSHPAAGPPLGPPMGPPMGPPAGPPVGPPMGPPVAPAVFGAPGPAPGGAGPAHRPRRNAIAVVPDLLPLEQEPGVRRVHGSSVPGQRTSESAEHILHRHVAHRGVKRVRMFVV